MPLLRVCSHPSCGRTIPATTTSRCAQHAALRRADDTRRRQHRRERDGRNLAAWQRTRSAVLERDAYTCADCGGHATHADRIPGGWHDADLDAYVSRCARCHGRRHTRGGAGPKQPRQSPRSQHRFFGKSRG